MSMRDWWNRRTDAKLERQGVSPEAVAMMRQHNLSVPNYFIPSGEAAPYYPESVRRILTSAPEPSQVEVAKLAQVGRTLLAAIDKARVECVNRDYEAVWRALYVRPELRDALAVPPGEDVQDG